MSKTIRLFPPSLRYKKPVTKSQHVRPILLSRDNLTIHKFSLSLFNLETPARQSLLFLRATRIVLRLLPSRLARPSFSDRCMFIAALARARGRIKPRQPELGFRLVYWRISCCSAKYPAPRRIWLSCFRITGNNLATRNFQRLFAMSYRGY